MTLAAGGRHLQAHKVVLSACSEYFQSVFAANPCQHPVVILKDVRYIDLESLVKYMYAGQVYIAQDQLGRYLYFTIHLPVFTSFFTCVQVPGLSHLASEYYEVTTKDPDNISLDRWNNILHILYTVHT